jgi:hypothetical protein
MEMTLHSRIREESKVSKADVLTVRAFLTRFSVNQCLPGQSVAGEAEIVHMRIINATHCFMACYFKISTPSACIQHYQNSNPYLGVEVVSG